MTADASRLVAALETWGGNVQRQTAESTQALARFTGDVPIKTGQLRGAIRATQVTNEGSRYRFRMVAPVIQAATTDKGARPHVIRPRRRGGVLVFSWPKAGGTVFLRHVNHPGNPPGNWWRPLLEQTYQQGLRLAARSVPFR